MRSGKEAGCSHQSLHHLVSLYALLKFQFLRCGKVAAKVACKVVDWNVLISCQQTSEFTEAWRKTGFCPHSENVGTKNKLGIFKINFADVENKYLVLVIAIMFRKEKVSLQCSLRCREQLHVSRASVDIHWDHFGFPYGTADVSCPLPPACQAPTHVAVTSAAIRNPGTFLEVQNQKALTVFPYNFTSCFSTMLIFTVQTVLQLVQTVEMLQLLGVNRIVIYKTNCSNETQRVLDYYTDKGLVEVVPWSLSKYLKVSRRAKPDQDPGDIHYFGQIPALNDCLYRFMYRSKYVALHDPDELILPQTVDSSITTKRHGADRCFNFENNWFPTEFTERPPPPNVLPALGHWHNVFGVNILTHLYREPVKPKPVFNNYKIIANPRSVFVVTVHGVLRSQENCAWVDRKTAHMYHTKARGQNGLKAQQLVYDGRLLSYSGRLTAAVNAVLNETRLLPE
uniref:Glycosyltransferase family 92 protein n=1 Tax=Poecilia mexicana TaxID=48701 RepID=A0A3B3WPX6_9TELE